MNYSLGVLTISLAAVAFGGSAHADSSKSAPLTVCNKWSATLEVALGYFSPGVHDPSDHNVLTGPFVSRGWSEIGPGECKSFENPFAARYMFWYGYGKDFNESEMMSAFMRNPSWSNHFCITNYFTGDGTKVPSFVNEEANVSVEACDRAGGDANPAAAHSTMWVTSRMVDTWINSTVNFTGCSAPGECGDAWWDSRP